MTRRQVEQAIAALAGATAVNAFGGAVYGLRGAPAVPRTWLRGSPFKDYRAPSAVLGIAVGGSATVAAVAAWRGSGHAPRAATAAGLILCAWIGAQVAVIGPRSPLQALMAGIGATLLILARRLG